MHHDSTPVDWRARLRVSRHAPAVLYLLLALAVAGPVLRPGLVLAVDLRQTPHPNLDTSYWGLAEGTHQGTAARLPLDAVFVALGHIGAVAPAQKVLLLAIIFLAGWGMHRLVEPRRAGAAVYAGLLYAINPFVYDRLYTGQWFLLLGYALLPWAFAAFRAVIEARAGAPWRFGALFAATAIASTHMAVLLGVLCVLTSVAHASRIRITPATARAVAGGFLLAGLLCLYWALPTPGFQDFLSHVGHGQLALYVSVPDPHWGLAPTVAGLSGYWNNARPATSFLPVWPGFALVFILLGLRGVFLRRREPTTWGVLGAGIFGFLLALGTASTLTHGVYGFVMDTVPLARSFREPQKGVALLAFAYAFLGAAAAEEILDEASGRRAVALVVSALAIALPLTYGARLLGGLHGALKTSRFPASWRQADDELRREASASRTLFLPWHGYLALRFAHNRVVANPAPSFFHTPILVSRSVGEGEGRSDVSDPVDQSVQLMLGRGAGVPHLGACLATLGVTHILLAHEADWAEYRFLNHRRDVVAVRRWRDMTLYRTRTPAALVMSAPRGYRACNGGLRPLSFRRSSPVRLELSAPAPPGRKIVLGLPQAQRWTVSGRKVRFGPWSAHRRNYVLGILGAIAFAASGLLRRRGQHPTG